MAGRPRGWPGPPANQGYGPAPPAPGLAGARGAQCPSRPGVAVPVNLSHKVKGIYSRPLPPSPSESGRGGACRGTGRVEGQRPAPPAPFTPSLGLGAASGVPRDPRPSRSQSRTFPSLAQLPGKNGLGSCVERGCRPGQSWNGGRESWRGGEVSLGLGGLPLGLPCPPLGALCQRRSRCLGMMPASPRDRVPAGAGTPVLAAE